jgi:endonuclease/exonuclease/phosphatase family metal-dependent hydrolase
MINIGSVNINSLNMPSKLAALKAHISAFQLDIVGLADIRNITENDAFSIRAHLRAHTFSFNAGLAHHGGTGILLINREIKALASYLDVHGDFLRLDIETPLHSYTLIQTYMPVTPSHKLRAYNRLLQHLRDSPPLARSIIMGDFNNVLNHLKDRHPPSYTEDPTTTILQNILDTHHLEDAFSSLYPDDVEFTYTSPSSLSSSRLDRIYATRNIINDLPEFTHIATNSSLSDHSHYPMLSIKDINAPKIGHDFWTFNNRHLRKPFVLKSILQAIEIYNKVKADSNDIEKAWTALIRSLTTSLKAHTKENTLRRHRTLHHLSKQIKHLSTKHLTHPNNREIYNALKQTRTQFENYVMDEAKYQSAKAKANYHMEGERPTKYMTKLHKKVRKRTLFKCLIDRDGQEKTSTEDLCRISGSFYNGLFNQNIPDTPAHELEEYLRPIQTKVPPDIHNRINSPQIDPEELAQSVLQMGNDKCPGSDGLSAAIFKTYYEQLKNPLLEYLNHCLQHKRMGPSSCEAIITLIYKKGDHSIITNYRPFRF